MMLEPSMKDMIYAIRLHAELIMYGDVLLDMEGAEENKYIVKSLTIHEGGSVAAHGEHILPLNIFQHIRDFLCSITFPDNEDQESSIRWEIVFYDQNENIIGGCEYGYWEITLLKNIVTRLSEFVGPAMLHCFNDIIDV